MINLITIENFFKLDLQQAWEQDHNKELYCKNQPKWDAADPKQSLINIREYNKSLCNTNKAPWSYMLPKDFVPFMHRNEAIG